MTTSIPLAIFGGPKAIDIQGPHYTWPRITEDVERDVQRQLHESISIAGKAGVFKEFEDEFKLLHRRRYGLLFNSGTSALHAAFFSLRLKPGDNVVVPDYTFFATASPLMLCPAEIRFCDCDQSGNLCPVDLTRLIDERTRAVVITHMWGIPCELGPILEICRRNGILLIEDCSHAHGAEYCDSLVGTLGDIAVWSLQGQKIISGGEGGILLTDDETAYELALLLGHYNKRCLADIALSSPLHRYAITGFGLKLRAHPLAITIALNQLRQLGPFLAGRRQYAGQFLDLIRKYDFIRLPATKDRKPSWYNLTFQIDETMCGVSAQRFFDALQAEGCREVDRPNSTRHISSYELFAHGALDFGLQAWSSNAGVDRPRAASYFRQAIKFPVWTFADEKKLSDAYLYGLSKVCEHVRVRGEI